MATPLIILKDFLYVDQPGAAAPALRRMATFARVGRLRLKQKRVVHYYRYVAAKDRLILPRGLVARVHEALPTTQILDQRLTVPPADFGLKWALRDYQEAAVSAIIAQEGGVVVAAPGSGKTIMGLALAARWRQPTLFLVHTLRLVKQTEEKARAALALPRRGLGIVADSAKDYGSHLTIATIQTLAKNPRYVRELATRVGTVIVDECVVAESLVDGVPIRYRRVGDIITTYDPATGSFSRNPITHVFTRPAPDTLIRVSAAGRSLVCTPNHPIWTKRGWKRADALIIDDWVFCQGGKDDGQGSFSSDSPVSLVRKTSPIDSSMALQRMEESGSRILLEELWFGLLPSSQFQDDGNNQQQICLETHEGTQSHASQRCEGTSESVPSRRWAQTANTRRKRKAYARTTEDFSRSAGMAYRSSCKDEDAPWLGISSCLQDRRGARGIDDRDRDRRDISSGPSAESPGREKRGVAEWLRVDGLTFLQRGRDAQFNRLCPDGLVYNLEVAEDHTFLTNGIVTHNCHHTPSDSFQKVVNSFPARHRAGLSVGGDTWITVRHDGQVERLRIEELARRLGVPLDHIADLRGYETWAYDPVTKAFRWAQLKAIHRYRNTKQAYALKTRYGRSVTITEDHSIFIVTNPESVGHNIAVEIVKGSELSVGDFLLADGPEESALGVPLGARARWSGLPVDIQSIELVEEAEVFDLSTDAETFCGNSLVLHNSATPTRDDGLGGMVTAILGPRVVIPRAILRERGVIIDPQIMLVDSTWVAPEGGSHAQAEKARALDPGRNALLAQLVWLARSRKQRVLVLVEREIHATRLAALLTKGGVPAWPVMGRLPTPLQDKRFELMEQGRAVVVATKLANEGLDWPALDCLVLATPGRSPTVLEQRTGRIARTSPGKTFALVYDVADPLSPVYLAQAQARLQYYKTQGYRVRRMTWPRNPT